MQDEKKNCVHFVRFVVHNAPYLCCLGQGQGLPKEDIVSLPIGYFSRFSWIF